MNRNLDRVAEVVEALRGSVAKVKVAREGVAAFNGQVEEIMARAKEARGIADLIRDNADQTNRRLDHAVTETRRFRDRVQAILTEMAAEGIDIFDRNYPLADIAMPIHVNGRLWGNVRVGLPIPVLLEQ
ncbi:hypothetical protein [Hydrogenophilus thiooxidans]|uniref:hypothetical protein n=1 Tax=Hydrogenophilus thiooxidans TaxID=2820326 RepID=UPI001C236544|nr:hypothetical protein [Hydrogenophilus thiooxidans]